MSNQPTLSDALQARFFAPLRRKRTRRVGVELELPVWNLTPDAATDFAAVHSATEDFLSRFPFSDYVRDDEGAVYRATDPATRDELSFDCSYNTLELSFGPGEDLNETHRRFVAYYSALQDAFGHHGHALTWLRPFKFEDLTQRGTVEFRSVCEQPVLESIETIAADYGKLEGGRDA